MQHRKSPTAKNIRCYFQNKSPRVDAKSYFNLNQKKTNSGEPSVLLSSFCEIDLLLVFVYTCMIFLDINHCEKADSRGCSFRVNIHPVEIQANGLHVCVSGFSLDNLSFFFPQSKYVQV